MQFWPRKRAKRIYPRVRTWPDVKDVKLLGFAGYKAGMTHIIAIDNRKTSPTKGMNISIPVTVIECPPIKVGAIRLYKKEKNQGDKLNIITEIWADNLDKELKRKIRLPKKKKEKKLSDKDLEKCNDVRLIVYTQPKKIKLKKKPEIFEIGIGGKDINDKYNHALSILGKEINVDDIFKEGDQVDIKSVTKGKGTSGPMKRFGIGLRSHKSEKARRNPGSLGAWNAQGKTMYRIAKAGQLGYQVRTEYNKQILKIGNNPKEINPKGGFIRYGFVNERYILIKGSVGGSVKRLIRFNVAIRPNKKIKEGGITIKHISLKSKQ